MVQLRILSGSDAGREVPVSRFPFTIGRGSGASFRLAAPGVWDSHFQLDRSPGRLVLLRSGDQAATSVNGVPVRETELRQGDVIEAGGARIQFNLGPARQAGLRTRETLTWIGWAALVVFQVWVMTALGR